MADDFVYLQPIPEIEAPFALGSLASRIRSSSNFLFAWQWYRRLPRRPVSGAEAMKVLGAIQKAPELHDFLREPVGAWLSAPFQVGQGHAHSRFEPADGEFEAILARGAADRLGAYSHSLAEARPQEIAEISALFLEAGRYEAFQLQPGNVPGCLECERWNSHLFSSWFYAVAWDWCFCVFWPKTELVWIGCLTDTD
jgi:hypothetical protein